MKMMEGDTVTDFVMEESCSALANIIATVENVHAVAIQSKGLVPPPEVSELFKIRRR